jgi:hypothetical protein
MIACRDRNARGASRTGRLEADSDGEVPVFELA